MTVPINDNIDYEGGVVTWIDRSAGERPFGNDLDPTLNLDILEVSFRNLARWKILETPQRLDTVRGIIALPEAAGGKRRVRRSALAHLLSAGALLRLFRPLLRRLHGVAAGGASGDRSRRRVRIDPRARVLAYVQDELIGREMNVFDAALALIALGHLGADVATFAPALHCIVRQLGEGGRHGPFKAYEWNKMKTPTRILVGGPEVTSAFVLMGLALARKAMMGAGRTVRKSPSPK